MPAGRPSKYNDQLADIILERMMDGESLRQICASEDMPHRTTILRWMHGNQEFASKCARARTIQADSMDDLILDVAHKSTPETAPSDKIKISAYQWRAMKLNPKKFSDRLIHQGDNDADPIRTGLDLSRLNMDELKTFLELSRKAEMTIDNQDAKGLLDVTPKLGIKSYDES